MTTILHSGHLHHQRVTHLPRQEKWAQGPALLEFVQSRSPSLLFLYCRPCMWCAVQFQFVRLRLCLWVEDLTLHLITMPDVPQLHLKMTWLYSYWVRSDHEFRIWLPGWEAGLLRSQRKKESEVAQSCPTLCDPMDCSLQRSSIHGIFQARVLEWVAISFSNSTVK